ncbi:MAG: ATP-binding protein [Candidatus Tectomicrobia bacterium]|nr:ATP-binding protein [Candidatus Tectomicrobia bacterium]
MARSPDSWLQVRQQFNPQEVLAGKRGQAFYTDRADSPERDVLITFNPKETSPPKALLAGHRGCGKTSLLVRLLEHFKDDYFLVYFDIEHNVDKERFTQVDLLYLIGGAIYNIAEQEQFNPNRNLFADLASAVYTLVYQKKQKVKDETLNAIEFVKGVLCFGAKMLGSNLGEALANAALKPFTFTAGVSEEIAHKREVQPQVQKVVNCVNRIIGDVESKAGKPLLLVVDGLDKIVQEKLVDLLFLESRALQGPVCCALYTVPMSLYQSFPRLRQDFRYFFFLPNVKLWQRNDDSTRDPQGYETMHQVVAHRLNMISAPDLIAPDVLNILIHSSGGVVRWLITLFHDACIEAQKISADVITEQAARGAISRNARGFQIGQDTERLKELLHVRAQKNPSGSILSRRLLQDQFILAYSNDSAWFDAHPLLWSALEERKVLTA